MAEVFIFVYQTICEVNGKSYVGVHRTTNINDGYIGCGIFKPSDAWRSPVFHKAVKKYGYNSFRRYIISFYDSYQEALDEERFIVNDSWVKDLSNYNCAIGGRGSSVRYMTSERKNEMYKKVSLSNTGKKRSKEFCDAISKRQMGVRLSGSHIQSLIASNSRYWLGKKRSEETRKKQSITCTGRRIPDCVRKKISDSKKGKPSPKSLQVIQYDLTGRLLAEYKSLPDAYNGTGVKVTTIHNSIKENRKTGSFVFKYKKDLA